MTKQTTKTAWRFLGSNSAIEGVAKLDEFGQKIELDPGEDRSALKVCCIPQKHFDEIGFTPEELNLYRYPAPHHSATAEFLAKKRAALALLHQLRTEKGE